MVLNFVLLRYKIRRAKYMNLRYEFSFGHFELGVVWGTLGGENNP